MNDKCYILLHTDDAGTVDALLFRNAEKAHQRMENELYTEILKLIDEGYECNAIIDELTAKIRVADSDIWHKWDIRDTVIEE